MISNHRNMTHIHVKHLPRSILSGNTRSRILFNNAQSHRYNTALGLAGITTVAAVQASGIDKLISVTNKLCGRSALCACVCSSSMCLCTIWLYTCMSTCIFVRIYLWLVVYQSLVLCCPCEKKLYWHAHVFLKSRQSWTHTHTHTHAHTHTHTRTHTHAHTHIPRTATHPRVPHIISSQKTQARNTGPRVAVRPTP